MYKDNYFEFFDPMCCTKFNYDIEANFFNQKMRKIKLPFYSERKIEKYQYFDNIHEKCIIIPRTIKDNIMTR